MSKKLDPKDRRRINRVKAVIEPWAAALGLSQSWSIVLGLHTDEESQGTHGGGAWVDWGTNYRKATVSFDRKTVDTATDEHLEMYALHELVHLVLAPLDDALENQIGSKGAVWTAYKDVREGVTDQIARHILNARDGHHSVSEFSK